ncbi:hypothetical protein CPB86DRAFT_792048 [Serendipita vermifera]|nr:hypothetical protein CPB86DRAFT_792048 [Serendipita vermifera]
MSINSLPFDIRRKILLYLGPSQDVDCRPLPSLLPLMLVCKDWADIIQNTPLFWTSVYLSFGDPRKYDKDRVDWPQEFAYHARIPFDRCGEALLSVHLTIYSTDEKKLDHLLRFLVRHGKTSQWRQLEIKMSWPATMDRESNTSRLSQINHLSRGFGSLEKLSINWVVHGSLLRWIDATSPRLHTLYVHFSTLKDLRAALPNTLNRISTLRMNSVDINENNIGDFTFSPSITTLRVKDLPLHRLNLTHIKHLTLHQANPKGHNELNQVMYPNLEALIIEDSLKSHPNVVLTSVKHLEVPCSAGNFQALNLPSLATLRVQRSARQSGRFVSGQHLASLPWWTKFTPQVLLLDVPFETINDCKLILRDHPQLTGLRIQFGWGRLYGKCLCHIFAHRAHNGDVIDQVSSSTHFFAPFLRHLTVTLECQQINSGIKRECALNILQERNSNY